MNWTETSALLALGLIKGAGPVMCRQMISTAGSAKSALLALESGAGIKDVRLQLTNDEFRLVRQKVQYTFEQAEQMGNKLIGVQDREYPERLRNCPDAPLVLFTKGNMHLNRSRVISIVGTRKATRRSLDLCKELISDLKELDPLVVSGLAFGVDIHAHRAALESDLQTVACLGHGLDRVYPSQHLRTARDMLSHGGLVSEFLPGTGPDRENFPKRNRLIAGMADCTLVVESGLKGGSMITAYIAHSYQREVMAIPGRPTDEMSQGCNRLIRNQVASIATCAEDLVYQMGWDLPTRTQQTIPFPEVSEKASQVFRSMEPLGKTAIDDLAIRLDLPMNALSALLLELEFAGMIRCLPGKVYETV